MSYTAPEVTTTTRLDVDNVSQDVDVIEVDGGTKIVQVISFTDEQLAALYEAVGIEEGS